MFIVRCGLRCMTLQMKSYILDCRTFVKTDTWMDISKISLMFLHNSAPASYIQLIMAWLHSDDSILLIYVFLTNYLHIYHYIRYY